MSPPVGGTSHIPKSENLPAKVESTEVEPRGIFPEILNPKKRAFLAVFCQYGRIVKSARDAGIHWTSHYHWLKRDKVYASAFDAAKQIAADHFEDEIYRRGFEGYERPVTYQGEITGHYTDYSDTLAIFALKGLRPEKYRDNAPIAPVGPKEIIIGYSHPPPELEIESKSDEGSTSENLRIKGKV